MQMIKVSVQRQYASKVLAPIDRSMIVEEIKAQIIDIPIPADPSLVT